MIEKIKNIKLSRTVKWMLKSLLLLGLAALTLSAVMHKKKGAISGVEMSLSGALKLNLIDKHYVRDLLVEHFGSDLNGAPIEFLPVRDVEKMFENDPYIKDAQVNIDHNGKLSIQLQERHPLMRILTDDAAFYLDDTGVSVPLSTHYSARVPIILLPQEGNQWLTDKKRKELVNLVDEINAMDFMKALVDQVEVMPTGEYEIIPLLGHERIKIGSAEELKEKFKNISLFYKKEIGKGKWSTCKYIDARYKGQIICEKSVQVAKN